MSTIKLVLLVLSAVCFTLSGLGVKAGAAALNFDGLGKAFFVASFLP